MNMTSCKELRAKVRDIIEQVIEIERELNGEIHRLNQLELNALSYLNEIKLNYKNGNIDKIQTIKLVRRQKNLGLKEAKDIVDKW